jgi:hypothetical protein
MSHPLIIEAIETLFVPVCIYNTARNGHDLEVLRRFKERRMNYPVVAIVNHNEKELTKRVKDYASSGKLLNAMVKALEKAKSKVPEWLKLLRDELVSKCPRNRRNLQSATFAMPCYYTGEVKLGGIKGVLQTTAASLKGKEVVEVLYDSSVVNYEDLVREAKKLKCTGTVFARTDEQEETARKIVKGKVVRTDDKSTPAGQKHQKYHIGKTEFRFIPMTPAQACGINSMLGSKKKADKLLSPGQQKLLEIIKKHKKAGWNNWIGDTDFAKACAEVEKLVAQCIEKNEGNKPEKE